MLVNAMKRTLKSFALRMSESFWIQNFLLLKWDRDPNPKLMGSGPDPKKNSFRSTTLKPIPVSSFKKSFLEQNTGKLLTKCQNIIRTISDDCQRFPMHKKDSIP
jgi:hypothetical protein